MRLGHFRVKTFEMVTSFHRLFNFKMHYQHAVEPPESFTCLTGSKWPMNVWFPAQSSRHYKYGQGLPLDVEKDIRLSWCNIKHAIDQGSLHTTFVLTNYIHIKYWIKYSALMGLKVIAKDP